MKKMKLICISLCFVCVALLIVSLFFPTKNSNRSIPHTSSSTDSSAANDSSASSSISPKAILQLHSSTRKPPTGEQCKVVQNKALSGLSTKERQSLQDNIRGMHMRMESEFIQNRIRTKLKSPSSPYWEFWEHTGTVAIAGEGKVDNSIDGAVWIRDLQKIYNTVQDTDLKADIQKMQDCVRSAVKNHDVDKLDELHKMLHDCDYWVVNYPVYFEKFAPIDWGGTDVYFNCLQCIHTDE